MKQTECKRCGICCTKGGPALHKEDLTLVKEGKLPLEKLITIRKGELAHNPLLDGVQPTSKELIKIVGSGKAWDCIFLNKDDNSCSIYESRPQSCKALKCWEPEESLKLIEKDTLTRLDIIEDELLRELISEHEKRCPLPDLKILLDKDCSITKEYKEDVEELVNNDLLFRTEVIKKKSMTLQQELLYFGRPVFQLLQPLGVKISETPQGIKLAWDR